MLLPIAPLYLCAKVSGVEHRSVIVGVNGISLVSIRGTPTIGQSKPRVYPS